MAKLLLTTLFAFTYQILIAQYSVTSFFDSKLSSLLWDSYIIDNNEYYLIITNNNTLLSNDGQIIDSSKSTVSIVQNTNKMLSLKASLNFTDVGGKWNMFYLFKTGDDNLGLVISTDASVEINKKMYPMKGTSVNTYLFELNGDEFELMYQLYNEGGIYAKPCYSTNLGTKLVLQTPSQKISNDEKVVLDAEMDMAGVDIFTFLIDCNSERLEMTDALAFDFYDATFRLPMEIATTWGNGALIQRTTKGCKAFRKNELLFDTEELDTESYLTYPLTHYLDKPIKPLLMVHDLNYIIPADAFTVYEGKFSFFMSPYRPSKICFNGECLNNPDENSLWEIVLKDYNWETGQGELLTTFKGNGTNIKAGAQNEKHKFLLGDYINYPSFWPIDESLQNKVFSNIFINEIKGHSIFTKPVLLESYDKPIAISRVSFQSAKIIDDKLILNIQFSIGLIVDKDTIIARSAGDMAIVTINLNEIINSTNEEPVFGSLSVYPNPANNQLTIDGLDINKGANFSIYAMTGQEVMKGDLSNATLDISSIEPGFYLLNIANENTERNVAYFIKE